ncbi:MAG: phosphatase PAP2 family protein [Deltaproteobacteria bacterium]|nr:phosphatase PAP2 family protein [Deltaproteobacteria bacterium]
MFALLFLALASIEICGLAWLVPLDASTLQWIIAQRSCSLDYGMFVLQDRALSVLIFFGGSTCLWLCSQRRWREAWRLVLVVLVGSFLCELLKTGIERVRPSALPPRMTGNSFPSGHVATACLVAGAVGFAVWHERRSVFFRAATIGLLGLLVGAVIWQRLYFGHHWLTDIVGSVLLSGAWLCFALPHPRLFVLTGQTSFIASGLLASYVGLYYFPGFRVSLPTAIRIEEVPVVMVTFGRQRQQELFHGAWGADAQEGVGPVTWLAREEAGLEVFLPQAGTYRLNLTVRPLLPSKAFACFPLEVAVNRHRLGSLLLYRGWRQYTLPLDAQWILPGKNTLTFRAGEEFPDSAADTQTIAFHQLRFLRDTR